MGWRRVRLGGGPCGLAHSCANPLTEDLLGSLIKANVTFALARKLLKIFNEGTNCRHHPKQAGRAAGTKPELRSPDHRHAVFEMGYHRAGVPKAESFVNKVLSGSTC